MRLRAAENGVHLNIVRIVFKKSHKLNQSFKLYYFQAYFILQKAFCSLNNNVRVRAHSRHSHTRLINI